MINALTRKSTRLMLGAVAALGLVAVAAQGTAKADPAPLHCPPSGCINLLKPNLVLGDMRIAPDHKSVTINFRNEHKATGQGFWIKFSTTDGTSCIWQPAMAAGQQATRVMQIPAGGQTIGSHYYHVKLDYPVACVGSPTGYEGAIMESDEFDNAKGGWYYVPLVLP
jgi:hypothetical protein